MSDPPEPEGTLEQIIEHADSELERINPSLFSPVALSRLKEKISEYVVELVSESIKVSKRHQSDTVSAAHKKEIFMSSARANIWYRARAADSSGI
ncbi:MAG: hypothetical protein L0229_14065 [Blastocatellia bacterium]|nr:hypothetical protein [Blastocatellia bacterium]